MGHKLTASASGRKYAAPGTLTTIESPQRTICNDAINDHSTPAHPTSFLAAISKPIGRKALCYELRISKHLLDMWISGERKDPIERTKDIMKAAAKHYGPDLPLDIAQELVAEFGGVVSMARKTKEAT